MVDSSDGGPSGLNANRKVLLIAEQANPEWVSVPLVGWSLAKAIADRCPTLIATHPRNRDAFIRAGMVEGVDFVAVDNERIAGPLFKIASIIRGGKGKGFTALTAFESLYYYAFEQEIWRTLGGALRAGEFRLVHRVTPLTPTAPSILASRCAAIGVPFVIGPLNGGLPWPRGFGDRRLAEREWLSYVRGLYRILPGYRSTRAAATSIIVGSKATLAQVPKRYRNKCILMPENGVWARQVVPKSSVRVPGPLRCLFVGRLVPYKCPDVLLDAAMPLLMDGRVSLTFVGDGPMLQALTERVNAQGVSANVSFRGWLSHANVLDEMSAADVLVLPSIREFGGGVVLEAMARGLPAVIANYGGPAELTDEETGYLVDFSDAESLRQNLGKTLTHLAAAPIELREKSEACVDKVARAFTWEAKAEQITQIYGVAESRGSGRTDRRA
jgi:phosphatidyl-myo-inositol dimannoside synthase